MSQSMISFTDHKVVDERIPKINKKVPNFEKLHEKLKVEREHKSENVVKMCKPFACAYKMTRNLSTRFDQSMPTINPVHFEKHTRLAANVNLPGDNEIEQKVRLRRSQQSENDLE